MCACLKPKQVMKKLCFVYMKYISTVKCRCAGWGGRLNYFTWESQNWQSPTDKLRGRSCRWCSVRQTAGEAEGWCCGPRTLTESSNTYSWFLSLRARPAQETVFAPSYRLFRLSNNFVSLLFKSEKWHEEAGGQSITLISYLSALRRIWSPGLCTIDSTSLFCSITWWERTTLIMAAC